ncbi:scarecrow-like protein 21 [Punica granatum]|uniref:Scarecrow-like protein 21 n=1 Tax=Punica granatum TaxID=22663 RepID=A0A6P8EEX1_PUNGR|nr:scarecrow-like protein 21 [Punica granatum]XP_031403929.1 scarecrow-like protein 21 [Punica granatum]XP_031403934.1 scarecrow-like protein 21 [Punica granatum]XP_031403943.1 scarecrow-like protein 21 [Punica granatum]
MDSHPLYRYSGAGAGLPSRFETLRFDVNNSLNSPFSANSDSENATPLSESREQPSSTDNFSGVSPSYNSSLDTSSYFERSSPSVEACEVFSQNENYTLWELEEVLMGPQMSGREEKEDLATPPNVSFRKDASIPEPEGKATTRKWDSEQPGSQFLVAENPSPQDIPSGDLKQLLVACAKAISDEKIKQFDQLIEKARNKVSISGEPIQRLGAYLIEGLVARKESSGTNIYRALRCREPESKDMLSYMQILYEICPYLKFGYMAANGAIAETCRHEDYIHIIDFQIAQGTQWLTLLQALAARPGGPPRVRITGIDDPVSRFARGAGLDAVEGRLAAISEKFCIPVEFHGLPEFAPKVTLEMLCVRPREALVVNFPLVLHHTPDESVDVNNPRDGLLRLVKSLSPKVVTVVEQESNTNTAPFMNRFEETLDYYLAMFESIDVTLPRDSKERINVEQHCLARDIVNIIASEGRERVERHELLGKWRSRFTMAGFRPYPLSSFVNSVIANLLRCYSEHYSLVEKDGSMLLGWKRRNLISASAWY